MAQFTKIANKNEIENGEMKAFSVNGEQITLANVDGEFLAFDGICTHANCALAGGFLEGYTLTCYCHGAQFDIQTGEVISPPAPKPLTVYKLKIEGEDILVEI